MAIATIGTIRAPPMQRTRRPSRYAPVTARKEALMPLPTILLVIALVCFVVAAFGFTVQRINLIALGLAFAVASVLAGSSLLG